MALSPRRALPYASALALLAALVVLAGLQYHWSEQAASAERERMKRNLDEAANLFRRDLAEELLSVCRVLNESDKAAENWQRMARHPELVSRFSPSKPTPGPFNSCRLDPEALTLSHENLEALLNRSFLQTVLLPDLARRHFSGPDASYRVEVRGKETLFRSSDEAISAPDLEIPLSAAPPDFFPVGGPPPGAGLGGGPGPGPGFGPRPDFGGPPFGRRPPPRGGGPERLSIVPAHQPWRLLVQHPSGSLDAAINASLRRSLAFGFGALALLGAGAILLLVSTVRAERLARMQMDFVAGVSHELRTPLAVICSAADNLADGKIQDPKQVAEYGSLVRQEGRRLATMVEQVLDFSAVGSGRRRFNPRPVAVAGAIAETLVECDSLIRSSGFRVECDVDPSLPQAVADPTALKQCLQNLIANAVKYGGAARWARVQAKPAGGEVHIVVEDRGMGIDPRDLPHIFEPFYRGREARDAQIHGAGLGLSLAHDFATAMGGRIEARSDPGRGSTFTLALVAARTPASKP